MFVKYRNNLLLLFIYIWVNFNDLLLLLIIRVIYTNVIQYTNHTLLLFTFLDNLKYCSPPSKQLGTHLQHNYHHHHQNNLHKIHHFLTLLPPMFQKLEAHNLTNNSPLAPSQSEVQGPDLPPRRGHINYRLFILRRVHHKPINISTP